MLEKTGEDWDKLFEEVSNKRIKLNKKKEINLKKGKECQNVQSFNYSRQHS